VDAVAGDDLSDQAAEERAADPDRDRRQAADRVAAAREQAGLLHRAG